MKRYLCCLTLLGLIAVPDWASACYFRQYAAPPQCCEPMPMRCSPPVVYVPVYVAPPGPPRVQQINPPAWIERETPLATPTPAIPMPMKEPVRPATATVQENPVKPSTPMPMPMPGVKDMNIVVNPPVLPAPPKNEGNTLKLPDENTVKVPDINPLKLPDVNPVKPTDVNPLKLPDEPLKLPDVPKSAVPTPAPAPDSTSLIPPMSPKLPALPNDSLPPLVLPPDEKGSTSKSSPITNRSAEKVQVLVAEGKPAFGPTRTVGFFNQSNSDIELVIEGRSVTLPKRSYITTELAPSFRWKKRDEETRTENVPDGAAGLDVVFKD